MASLFNQQISQTYQGLLKTTGNGVLTGSLAQITDGSGNGSKLYLSTSKINFYNEYEFPTTDGSANQVLKTDGSGTLSWVAQSSGTVGISGSPTANQIAIWTNATTIKGMSAIEIDSNNKITLSQVNSGGTNTGSYIIGGGNITNHTGTNNVGFGLENLNVLTSGSANVALGYRALKSVTTALSNVAIGYQSLEFIATTTSHDNNTAVGLSSGRRNNGGNNTFIGFQSGQGSTTASNNTGVANTALGYLSLNTLTSGNSNTAIGTLALEDNTTGLLNTCVGHSAGKQISTGSKNVILGSNDGTSIATSSNNIIISDGDGNNRIQVTSAGKVQMSCTRDGARLNIKATGTQVYNGLNVFNSSNEENWIYASHIGTKAVIGESYLGSAGYQPLAIQTSENDRITIATNGNIQFNTYTSAGTLQVDSSGNITSTSDSSLKNKVDKKIAGLAEVLKLEPRVYTWKAEEKVRFELGFFADEVKDVIPEAAPQGEDGLYGLLDRSLIASLTKAIQEQQVIIEDLKSRIKKLEL